MFECLLQVFSIWIILQTAIQFIHVCPWFFLFFGLNHYFLIPSALLSYTSEVNAIRKHACLISAIDKITSFYCNYSIFLLSFISESLRGMVLLSTSSPPMYTWIFCNLISSLSTFKGGAWPLDSLFHGTPWFPIPWFFAILNICNVAAVFVTGIYYLCLFLAFETPYCFDFFFTFPAILFHSLLLDSSSITSL